MDNWCVLVFAELHPLLQEGCGLHFVLCKIIVVKRLCFETTKQHVVKLLCMSSLSSYLLCKHAHIMLKNTADNKQKK